MAKLSEINPEFADMTMFLMKFTKKTYAESLQKGNLFMNDFRRFIEIEKTTGIKGQGDVLEGTAVINLFDSKIIDNETENVIAEGKADRMTFTHNDLLYQPVFCATSLDGTLLEVIQEDSEFYESKLIFTEEKKSSLRRFSKRITY